MAVTKNLVLGGSGLVGGALCNYLKQIGQEVINIDYQNGPEYDLRTMDLTPYKDVHYVWFLAWDVGGAKYLTNEKNLLNIMRNNSELCTKVFGFLEQYQIPFMFTSTQLANVDNVYGLTKIVGEQWTKLLGGKIVRFWNVYGWEVPGERSHVVPDLVHQAIKNGRIDLMTTGEEERQFVYIDDCARNLVAIRESNIDEVDMTSGSWIKIKALAEIVGQELNVPVYPGNKLGYQNKITPHDAYTTTIQIPLEEGVRRIIAKAREHFKANQ